MKRTFRLHALALALLSAAAPAAAQSRFTTIPGIPGYGPPPAGPSTSPPRVSTVLRPAAISANGAVVVGLQGYLVSRFDETQGVYVFTDGGFQAFAWDGRTTIGLGYPSNATGTLPSTLCGPLGCTIGIRESYATGVSADGRVIVGYGRTGCVGFYCSSDIPQQPSQAFVWTAAGGLRPIAGLGSEAQGVSGNGTVVVGRAGGGAFAWTADGGVRLLSPGTSDSVAYAASYDGQVIVGQAAGRAMRWSASGATAFQLLAGYASSVAADVSFDGRVAVGTSFAPSGLGVATLWSNGGLGATSLGTLTGHDGSNALAVSGDGKVVVGTSYALGGDISQHLAFRWTGSGGMQSVADWLARAGVGLPAGAVLSDATGVNYSGNVLVGTYYVVGPNDVSGAQGYLARVGDAGSGFIADLDAYRAGVQETAMRHLDAAASLQDLSMSSARRHGGWAAAARRDARGCAWLAAERTQPGTGGDLDRRELGGCVDAGRVRFGLGYGLIDARTTTSFGGGANYDARYALLGASVALGRVDASLTGFRGTFDADVERRYANGAAFDASRGSTDGDLRGVVARLDGVAWRSGRFDVPAYAVASVSRAETEAFTESGGGFPVAYGAGRIDRREFALGALGRMEVGSRARVGLGLEAAWRRLDSGEGIGARVIDLFEVAAPGSTERDSTLRGLLDARWTLSPAVTLRAGARHAFGRSPRADDVAVSLNAAF